MDAADDEEFDLLVFKWKTIRDHRLLERVRNGYSNLPPHAAIWETRIVVELFYKGAPLEGKLDFLPEPKVLNWNHVIIDPRSHWFGWLPVDAVMQRLRELLAQLGGTFGNLSLEFLIFSSFINAEPSRVRILCDLSGGQVAAKYDYLRRESHINGTSFLCRPDALLKGILLHETSHAIDHNTHELDSAVKIKEFLELVDKVEKARVEMNRTKRERDHGQGRRAVSGNSAGPI